jgi:hypothetical protein
MTFATDDITKRSLETFQRFDADTQLALLWFGYKDIKEQLTPAPSASVEVPATALYEEIRGLSQQEQLQAQRDIAAGADTQVTKLYKALSTSGRLEVWLLLAQGMEEGSVIQVPDDYELPAETNEFVETITDLDFEQRVNFMRSAVMEMGAK